MKIFVTLRVAGRALLRNKMRSILTMLGMIIGVGAVIVTVSLGNGAKAQMEAQIAGLGQNVVIVYAWSVNRGGVRSGFGSAGTLTVDDAAALQREIPEIITLSPERRYNAQVAAGDLNWSTSIQGEGETYLDIRHWPLSDGAMFSEQDVHGANKVAIIGQTVASQLFPDGDVVGQAMRVKNVPFIVLGVLSPKGLSVQGQDQDDVIIMPYTTLMKRLQGVTSLSSVTVQTVSAGALSSVQQQITDILRQRHRTNPLTDDFTVRTQQEIADVSNSQSETMRALLAGVALVSLLVGGIGIMNIMLVSVTERTREIGIRMAVGAHGRDILTQFLTEAVMLSLLGGILGISAGVEGSRLVTYFKQWPTLIPTVWIVVSFVVSGVVGVFFGFYPAWKASQLDPIDALRYE
jgi:putative ABC transport system permease protein